LLFVHPRTIVEPVKIDATVDVLSAVLGETSPIGQQSSGQTPIEPWSPAHTPSQVKLVEILQFLLARPFRDRPLPLAVVVSAWDLLPKTQRPNEWLRERLPLLDQFLEANAEAVPVAVFGISAQGADLSKAVELQQHIEASDRIIVTTPDGSTTHDITAPVKWLLER
jgi:hypothetical protein